MKRKEKYINIKRIVFFVFQVALPIVAVPILPIFINGCSDGEAFVIGLGFSIFFAVWDHSYNSSEAEK